LGIRRGVELRKGNVFLLRLQTFFCHVFNVFNVFNFYLNLFTSTVHAARELHSFVTAEKSRSLLYSSGAEERRTSTPAEAEITIHRSAGGYKEREGVRLASRPTRGPAFILLSMHWIGLRIL